MEILSQEQEQNQVQEPNRRTIRGDGAESGQLLRVTNVEAFTGASTWSGSRQEISENKSDTAPAGYRVILKRDKGPNCRGQYISRVDEDESHSETVVQEITHDF
jgi:hypothetical protein